MIERHDEGPPSSAFGTNCLRFYGKNEEYALALFVLERSLDIQDTYSQHAATPERPSPAPHVLKQHKAAYDTPGLKRSVI
jgi:hypothetical protein